CWPRRPGPKGEAGLALPSRRNRPSSAKESCRCVANILLLAAILRGAHPERRTQGLLCNRAAFRPKPRKHGHAVSTRAPNRVYKRTWRRFSLKSRCAHRSQKPTVGTTRNETVHVLCANTRLKVTTPNKKEAPKPASLLSRVGWCWFL